MNKLLCSVYKREYDMLKNDLLSGAKEAADYIGETQRAVYNMAEKGHLPCTRKGRKLYFRKSELDRAFSSGPQL